ncbi:response regulator transcription factor [Sinomonas halotolerans]|uniref:Response regulator transcription factor n=1 Tax=Sinomonas halotolerans TaxID=1644133 RepID=A0ABU9X2P7_9MICC
MRSTRHVRVFILDGHELVRRGLRSLLEGAGVAVVGESDSAREALRDITGLRADVAVLGTTIMDGFAVEVCRELRSMDPRIRCIILNDAHDQEAILDSILAGAHGYFAKDISNGELLDAILRAAAGEPLFDPDAESRIRRSLAAPDAANPRLRVLTPQERRVLALIGQGLTNREIARELSLAEKTAQNYASSVLAKLGAKHRTEAALHFRTAFGPDPNGGGQGRN